jgi:2-polyprenyl-3-methyl-5-hydroxy-6-metoxy-1,4-benzoquinol methylase
MKEKPYIWNTSQGTTQSRLKLTGKRKSFIEHMRGEGYNITALDLIDKVICYDSMRADELPNWVLIEIRNATVQRLNGSGKVKTM